MTYNEHRKKAAAQELGTVMSIVDMIERGVDVATMRATLERRADELERVAGLAEAASR